MAISDRDRKILWALAGNACSRCDVDLVRLPEVEGDVHAMVGRECHIVAKSLTGPRGDENPCGEIDGYPNFILLCANCHAVIDDQSANWTPDALRKLKHEHEQKVKRHKTPPDFSEIKLRGRDQPFPLKRMTSGDTLLGIVGGAFSYTEVPPDSMSSSQREVVGDFLQSVRDWGEAFGEIGPKGHMDAGQNIQEGLDSLREEGLIAYAGTRQLTLDDGAGRASPWPETVIRIVKEEDVIEKPSAAPIAS